MTTITIWQRYNPKTETWHHNHISDGWDGGAQSPTPQSESQRKSWRKATWRKDKAALIDGVVTL